jgi:hypothetical protein
VELKMEYLQVCRVISDRLEKMYFLATMLINMGRPPQTNE